MKKNICQILFLSAMLYLLIFSAMYTYTYRVDEIQPFSKVYKLDIWQKRLFFSLLYSSFLLLLITPLTLITHRKYLK